MSKKLIWDEEKRRRNLIKHGLDFANATEVLDSHYRLDIEVVVTESLVPNPFPTRWDFWQC